MSKQIKIVATGLAAIQSAELGATLYVKGLDGVWVEAGPGALDRAKRMDAHATWIYGVRYIYGS